MNALQTSCFSRVCPGCKLTREIRACYPGTSTIGLLGMSWSWLHDIPKKPNCRGARIALMDLLVWKLAHLAIRHLSMHPMAVGLIPPSFLFRGSRRCSEEEMVCGSCWFFPTATYWWKCSGSLQGVKDQQLITSRTYWSYRCWWCKPTGPPEDTIGVLEKMVKPQKLEHHHLIEAGGMAEWIR